MKPAKCPACGRTLRVHAEFRGRKIKCLTCSERFVVETAPPPNDEKPESEHWYYKELGKVKGPLSSLMIRSLVSRGEIGQETWVLEGLNGKWLPAVKVPGLFDVREGPKRARESSALEQEYAGPHPLSLIVLGALTVSLAYLASVLGRAIIP
jgi:GYF domain 2